MDEPLTPRAGRVVQTGPATRSIAITATLLALLALLPLGVVLILTRSRPCAAHGYMAPRSAENEELQSRQPRKSP